MKLSDLFGGRAAANAPASSVIFTSNSTTQQVITTSDTVFKGLIPSRISPTGGYSVNFDL